MSDETEGHVFFDEEFKTFRYSHNYINYIQSMILIVLFSQTIGNRRLYPGKSLYAFCISPELSLEHLYWGKTLHEGYDLRYLSESTRMTCFTTSELYESRTISEVELENFHQAETIEEILEVWRKNRSSNSAETLQQRRMENLSWRMMAATTVPPPSSITTSNKETNKAGFFSTGSHKNDEITSETKRATPPKSSFQNFTAPPNSLSSPEATKSPERSPRGLGFQYSDSDSVQMYISPSLPSSPSSKRLLLDSLRIPLSTSSTPLSGSPRFSRSRTWSSTVALDHIEERDNERQRTFSESSMRSTRPLLAQVEKDYC